MAVQNTAHFRDLLSTETNRLSELCLKWRERVNTPDSEEIPDDIQGQIRSTIGQAELLMRQRFNQFNGLIDACEFNLGEKKTTCEDLAGFWDMVFFQVEDVDRKFVALSEAEKRKWAPEEKKIIRPKVHIKVVKQDCSTEKSSHLKKSLEARKRLKEAKAQKMINESAEKENQLTFEAPCFFVVSSPLKKDKKCLATPVKNTPTPQLGRTRTPLNTANFLAITKVNESARKTLSQQLTYDL